MQCSKTGFLENAIQILYENISHTISFYVSMITLENPFKLKCVTVVTGIRYYGMTMSGGWLYKHTTKKMKIQDRL